MKTPPKYIPLAVKIIENMFELFHGRHSSGPTELTKWVRTPEGQRMIQEAIRKHSLN